MRRTRNPGRERRRGGRPRNGTRRVRAGILGGSGRRLRAGGLDGRPRRRRAARYLEPVPECREHGLLSWMASRLGLFSKQTREALDHAERTLELGRRLSAARSAGCSWATWSRLPPPRVTVTGPIGRSTSSTSSPISGGGGRRRGVKIGWTWLATPSPGPSSPTCSSDRGHGPSYAVRRRTPGRTRTRSRACGSSRTAPGRARRTRGPRARHSPAR